MSEIGDIINVKLLWKSSKGLLKCMQLNSEKYSIVVHNLKLNPLIVSCLFHSILLQILIPLQGSFPWNRV